MERGQYPRRWAMDAVLADGATVHVRPIREDDAQGLVTFHAGLSAETVRRRFFGLHPVLSQGEVHRFTTIDYVDRMAFVAVGGEQIVAVARFDRLPATAEAEVAFVVADAEQGRGLGSLLLEYLAARARECGITRFVAETLFDNRSMLEVFRRAGFVETTRTDHGVILVTLDIEPTGASLAAIEAREWSAGVRSVVRLLRPRSVAVVGAGRNPAGIGHTIVRNLLEGGFRGTVIPVNSGATEIAGLPAAPSVEAARGPVDLALIAVPAPAVLAVVEECARAGVHGLVVISSGFAETGPDGATMERAVVAAAHRGGMRLIGPNCMGVINTAEDVRLDATFAPTRAIPGGIGFASQSGALGIALLERSRALGLGLSAFVSMGNKADISGNDLLRYFEQDAATRVVLLYLESFGNARTFARVAGRVSRRKPIVALKAGRTAAGTRAAASHTASMASPDVAVDALFRQAGVIRVETVEEMLDAGALLAHQPLPAGRRMAILGNAGGAGILAADAGAGAGLEVPELGPHTTAALRALAGANAGVSNPVDLGAGAGPEVYGRALTTLLASGEIDGCVVVVAPVAGTDVDAVAAAVSMAQTGRHPLVFVHLARDDVPAPLRGGAAEIPCLPFPERAVRALGRAAAYATWRARPPGTPPHLDGIDAAAAGLLVAAHLSSQPGGGWLGPVAAGELLRSFGIPTLEARVVESAAEAGRAVTELAGPVALKLVSDTIVHKTDVGGVVLDVTDPGAAAAHFTELQGRIGGAMSGLQVQRMAPVGVEVIVGVVNDALFGPLVLFGSGGVAVEILGDRAFRILPLTRGDASDLVRATRGSALLRGYRGAPACDVDALEDLLLRVGRLAEEVPQLAEMDLNPVVVSPAGCVAVDARIRLVPWHLAAERSVRRIR